MAGQVMGRRRIQLNQRLTLDPLRLIWVHMIGMARGLSAFVGEFTLRLTREFVDLLRAEHPALLENFLLLRGERPGSDRLTRSNPSALPLANS